LNELGRSSICNDERGLVTIRPLRHEDRDHLRRLLMETAMFTDAEVDIALELIDSVLQNAEQQDYMINVYDDGGAVLGYYCIGPTPATEGTFDLYWIAVKPTEHGRGVGGALDAHAAEVVQSRGGQLLLAETSSQPRYEKTRKFYLHHGYRELARIPGYYRPGDDLVVYGKYFYS
jgi:GNAT superfamily N-acetyltransferase